MLKKIISGGQTGVDRAALDLAIERGIPHGGWCPRGRRAEDGTIPARYELTETATSDYAERTEKNVLESDGTLILYSGRIEGGTKFTDEFCALHKKPAFRVNLASPPPDARPRFQEWLQKNTVQVLNIAGPRDLSTGEIYQKSKAFLKKLI